MAPPIATIEQATRLARAIASDISLYNEEKIKKGLEDDTFFDAITEELAEGREHFKGRVDASLHDKGIYERAINDVIIARKVLSVKSRIW